MNSAVAPDYRSVPIGRMLAVILTLFLAITVGICASALRLDSTSRVAETQLVANAIKLKLDDLRRVAISNTVWDDAVTHLDSRFDATWADVNVGQYYWKLDDSEVALVLGAYDRPIYASYRGVRTSPDKFASISAAIAPLVKSVRAGEIRRGPLRPDDVGIEPAVDGSAIVRSSGLVYLITASLVQPDHNTHASPSVRAPIVVIGHAVDSNFIAEISSRYLLKQLKLLSPGEVAREGFDSVPLGASEGANGYRLAWKRVSPVRSLLVIAGPPLAAILLALGIAPFLIIRMERRNRILSEASRDAQLASTAKSAFLATMSHEIRTPLNGVLGMAQAMAMDALDPTQRERLEVIRRSGGALLVILDDVLDFSKIEAGKLDLESAEFDIEDLARSVHDIFAPAADAKDCRFDLIVAPAATGVYLGDPTRVRQVLCNLISNALKFTETGAVSLSIGVPARHGLELRVRDSGIGMSQAQIGSLFNKFQQADTSTTRRFGGTGLGLAICRELTVLMGGQIQVESQPGEGSTFTVTLPLERLRGPDAAPDDSASKGQPAAAHQGDLQPSALRVLAAEDNQVNQLVLKALLQHIGVSPTIVESGKDAVDAWESQEWDLILMDVQMPRMDGPDATRIIRQREGVTRRRRTPIVALTANVMSHQVDNYLAAGMDGFVAKPIEVGSLFAAIETALTPEAAEIAQVS